MIKLNTYKYLEPIIKFKHKYAEKILLSLNLICDLISSLLFFIFYISFTLTYKNVTMFHKFILGLFVIHGVIIISNMTSERLKYYKKNDKKNNK